MTFDIVDFRAYSPVYVETDYAWGDSLDIALKAGFKRLKGCDIHEPFFRHCLARFKNKPVELYLGKPTDVLHKMLEDVYEPAVISLNTDPTILNELEIILSHRGDHIIILHTGEASESPFKNYISSFRPYKYTGMDLPDITNTVLVCEPF